MNALCLLIAAAQAAAPCPQAPSWRAVATDADRARLRDARATWTAALSESGKTPSAEPRFGPDFALDTPVPPAGAYRCRIVRLGGTGRFAEQEWGRCEVGDGSLVKLDGPQRPTGRIFADGETRAVFLGTLILGDETRPLRYGRDDGRDLAGLIERVGPGRWRVAMPRPALGGTLDLLELTPA